MTASFSTKDACLRIHRLIPFEPITTPAATAATVAAATAAACQPTVSPASVAAAAAADMINSTAIAVATQLQRLITTDL